MAEKIRHDHRYNRIMYLWKSSSDRTIVCQLRKQWLETVRSYFKSDEYKTNPDYTRLLFWRNKTAAEANRFVRSRLWGKDAPIFVPGDRLIARKPLFRPRPGQKGKNKCVFLDTEDLQGCPDLQKMLYTALTRAKVRVFILVN